MNAMLLRAGAAPAAALLGAHCRRLVHSSGRVLGLGSHMSDNDPDILAREKKRNLKGEPARMDRCFDELSRTAGRWPAD
jgi:hypothetical protein